MGVSVKPSFSIWLITSGFAIAALSSVLSRCTTSAGMPAGPTMPAPTIACTRPANMIDRAPPRVRATELWRVPAQYLQEAQEDATLVAIRATEEIGIDVDTDGEIRRESIDQDNPVAIVRRSGRPNYLPRIVGPIRRMRATWRRSRSRPRSRTSIALC